MKLAYLLSALTMVVSFSAFADNASIADQQEKELDADHDTIQIKDVEAEQRMAREQALAQEQMQRDTDKRLESIKIKKVDTLNRAKTEIASYETRRKHAEKSLKESKTELDKVTAEIAKTEASIAKAQAATKNAEGLAQAGREELNKGRNRRAQLEQQNRQANYAQAQSEAEISRMKEEWAALSTSIKDLEQRVQMNEAAAKKKAAMQAQGKNQIARMQQREAQLKSQLSDHVTTVADTNHSPAQVRVAAAPKQAVQTSGPGSGSKDAPVTTGQNP